MIKNTAGYDTYQLPVSLYSHTGQQEFILLLNGELIKVSRITALYHFSFFCSTIFLCKTIENGSRKVTVPFHL